MPDPVAAARFDLERLTRLPRWLLLALIAGLALLVVFAELPQRPLLLRTLQKLGHPTVFGLIALAALVLARRPGPAPRQPWRDYLAAFAVAVALGAATEIGQIYTHRDPAVADVLLDARGALCALALAACFDRRVTATPRGRQTTAACALTAFALALLLLQPLAWSTAAYGNRGARFPQLFVPGGRLDLYFIEPRSRLRLVGETPAALRVPLIERPYAGASLIEPSPDWRGYRTLNVEVTNPGPGPLVLNLRVHDAAHNQSYADRFNARFALAPGERRTLTVPLAAIAAAPRGRPMDMAAIAGIVLFRAGDGGPAEFRLHRIWLE